VGALSIAETEAIATSSPGQMLGTVAYMAPEQILGQDVDMRADLFALGIILYQMIAGRHPWPRVSTIDTMHAILHDDPPALTGVWAGVIANLLHKDRDDRYASATSVLEVLATPSLTDSALADRAHA
jgi:serine/threonine protein kinase